MLRLCIFQTALKNTFFPWYYFPTLERAGKDMVSLGGYYMLFRKTQGSPPVLPLLSVLPWTAAFHLAEHPAKVVCICHADRNAYFIHSHICEAKQLLGSGDPL